MVSHFVYKKSSSVLGFNDDPCVSQMPNHRKSSDWSLDVCHPPYGLVVEPRELALSADVEAVSPACGSATARADRTTGRKNTVTTIGIVIIVDW